MILIFWLLSGAIVWSLFVYDCYKHMSRIKPILFLIISILLFVLGPVYLLFKIWEKINALTSKRKTQE